MQTTSLAEVRALYLGVDCVRRCSAGGETVCKLSLMRFLWHFYRDYMQGSYDERQIEKIFLSCSSVQF